MSKAIKAVIDFVMDVLETVVFIGSMFIVIYLFILTPNQVKGASMEPSFYSGEYILTSRVTYKFRKMQRGDVIVFKSPKNPDIEYIKRIIGLPGDQIMIKNAQIFVNNTLINERYISAPTNLWDGGCVIDGEAYTVTNDSLFVMGDNRPRSSDSREFCAVKTDSVIGQVFYRYFPANKIGTVINPLPLSIR
ncbi:signal peptidase I [Candidatus Roizmanbacteria bacterium CG22_combo_CG10-13_8_21_14_all_35_9]|uniref:Signal peptidase I n=2 Tax=Candidatus Roizmaniibacteriota TaxID=1752723 RepID=A0A2H0C080_9BACT|nr:MAG: signal peptidase I [Candidatus Roizmanbacteria bacterium CG23_combo_of_CG06-09_8_20_14_all_35_49]PIP62720.1 MAG: signal peptidase I [Candidatus Roizmanbacteria bacterium CG22_combo_CG10-13_8_21_14_all_35_9]